jgi:undecaprenyl-diphosphatase
MEIIIVKFLASFLIWLMFFGLLVLWFIDGKIKKEQVLHALLACLMAWITTEILKGVFDTTRPFIVEGAKALTLTIPKDGAFPSSHTALAYALATTIWLHDKKVGWIYLVLALLVGAARVIANVHYPADILGGALIGIFISFVIEKIHLRNFFKK